MTWYNKYKRPSVTCTVPQPYNNIGDGPEGPEVYVMTQKLHRRFPPGHILQSIEPIGDRYKDTIPKEFLASLPLKITKITSKGKKTIVKFQKQWSLLISYGMSGHWQLKKNKYAQLRFTFSSVKGDESCYYWTSSRSLPTCVVQFLRHTELATEIEKLGYDIIRDDPTPEDVLGLYTGIRKNICAFMMEQDKFCGIGNYVKAAVLYRCEISPHRKVHQLDDGEKWLIWEYAKEVANEAIAAKGMGISDENGVVVGVAFDITPYNCKKDKHGNPSTAENIAGRMTWWVPKVQK